MRGTLNWTKTTFKESRLVNVPVFRIQKPVKGITLNHWILEYQADIPLSGEGIVLYSNEMRRHQAHFYYIKNAGFLFIDEQHCQFFQLATLYINFVAFSLYFPQTLQALYGEKTTKPTPPTQRPPTSGGSGGSSGSGGSGSGGSLCRDPAFDAIVTMSDEETYVFKGECY